MKRMLLVVCVALCCSVDVIGEEAPSEQRVIDLSDDFCLIGRSGLPLGHEFRAKFAFIDGLLQLASVNGTDLKVPLPLRPPPRFEFQPVDPLYDGHNASDDLEQAARRGVEIWAYEVGQMAADVPDANDPDRRVLGFRSRICLRDVVGEGDQQPRATRLPVPDVRVDQLSTKVTGCLGHELGQWLTIKGVWSNEGRGLKFRVLEVNGQKFTSSNKHEWGETNTSLDLTPNRIRPCRFSKQADVLPSDGSLWQLEAYEMFSFEELVVVNDDLGIWKRRPFARFTGLRWRDLRVSNPDSEVSE